MRLALLVVDVETSQTMDTPTFRLTVKQVK
jgi:hypothetical protein